MDKGGFSKEIFLFAGPNGSGKSTIIENFLENKECPRYYICPDNLVDKRFKNDVDKYIEAMKKAEALRENALLKGKSFTFESVLSTTAKIDFLKKAKEAGYYITTVFVTTSSPEINISRVKRRVKQGGHNVPVEKIRKRYYSSMILLSQAFEISDNFYVFDNSTDDDSATSVLVHQSQYLGVNKDYENEDWVQKYIIDKCKLHIGDYILFE